MDLAANLHSIQQRIDVACGRAGRDPASVTLLRAAMAKLLATRAQLPHPVRGQDKRGRDRHPQHRHEHRAAPRTPNALTAQPMTSEPSGARVAMRTGESGDTPRLSTPDAPPLTRGTQPARCRIRRRRPAFDARHRRAH